MLTAYILKMMRRADYKLLDDGRYFGEISGLKGVWAEAKTLEECRSELQSVLEDWLVLKVQSREKVPGFVIQTDKRRMVSYA